MIDARFTLANEQERSVAAVLDTLLPGDEGFPSASAAGTTGFVIEQAGTSGLQNWLLPLLAALDETAGGQFATCAAQERSTLLQQLEAGQPVLFARLLALAYYSYYAQPLVIAAIRALGHDYNQTPQPRGYVMTPFDPTNPTHLPASPRGSYQRTLEMARVVLP